MNKLVSYLSPLWVWVGVWWCVMNGAMYTVVSALAGNSFKGILDELYTSWLQWKGLFTWL